MMIQSADSNTIGKILIKNNFILIALFSMMISVCAVQPVEARLGNASYDPNVLYYMCKIAKGVWSPPSNECGGCFHCYFPDGTLINCDGDGNCDVSYFRLNSWDLFYLITKTQLDLQQTPQGPPDLVPLPASASTPPEGFCRRNNQGQLLVNIYNQGGGDAATTDLRIVFGSDNPVDYDTPSITAGSGTDLIIDIPNTCFDTNTLKCSFTIGVDARNEIAESNEVNNNATGLCGPQFQ